METSPLAADTAEYKPFIPSLPPTEEKKPTGLFKYRPRPAESFEMQRSRAADRYMMQTLSHLADRAQQYESLETDNPDRLRFEYKRAILVEMYRIDNLGTAFLGELGQRLAARQKTFSPAHYRAAIWELIDALGVTS